MGRRNFLNKFNPKTTLDRMPFLDRELIDEKSKKKNRDAENDAYTGISCIFLSCLEQGRFFARSY